MDTSILDPDTKFGSATLLKFVKNASFLDLCKRHSENRHHRSTPSMASSIKNLEEILDQLESKNIVYSYLDASTNWKQFYLTDEAHNIMNSKSNNVVNIRQAEEIPTIAKVNSNLDHLHNIASKFVNTLRSAMRRNLDFNLTMEDVEVLMAEKVCYYTGKPFTAEDPLTFDRIDSNKGYIKGNVVACSDSSNKMKNTLLECADPMFKNIAELKKFVDNIYIATSDNPDPLSELFLEAS